MRNLVVTGPQIKEKQGGHNAQACMVPKDPSLNRVKLLLLAPNLLTASRWRSFKVVGGRQRYFVLFPYDTNETTGSLAVFHRHSH